jgi:hypothetical protein
MNVIGHDYECVQKAPACGAMAKQGFTKQVSHAVRLETVPPTKCTRSNEVCRATCLPAMGIAMKYLSG